MVKKYGDLYLQARRTLLPSEGENASMAARELLAFASGKSVTAVLADSNLYASEQIEEKLSSYVNRMLAHEPLPYILGQWDFYGLSLEVTPDVLIPRDDTMAVTDLALDVLRGRTEPRVLDLCCGSGCIGLAVASQVLRSRVLLGEWDEEALKVCRQNIRRNQLSARVTSLRMDAREKPSRQLGEFDCIVSNPPYIPTADIETLDPSVRDHEPHLALDGGADGLDFYRVIADKWRDALLPNGLMAFEVGIGQADEVLRIMRANGFGDIQIVKDLHGIPRVVYGRLCKEI